MLSLYYVGMICAVAFSALGSAFGTGIASQAAVGGWKKCFLGNKSAPFILSAFAGAPLTQTIYGFLLAQFIQGSTAAQAHPLLALITGITSGVAIGASALFQGKVAAASADSLSETGKGTANYFIVIGIVETVALFTLIFSLLILNIGV